VGKINSRAKGSAAEREIFGIFNELLGSVEFKRNLLQSRVGGADNEPTGVPVAIEVKRHEKPHLNPWMQQCLEQASAVKATPVLVWRSSRQPWRVAVVMTPEQFVDYYRGLKKNV
jgi:Holliday junction resolvase